MRQSCHSSSHAIVVVQLVGGLRDRLVFLALRPTPEGAALVGGVEAAAEPVRRLHVCRYVPSYCMCIPVVCLVSVYLFSPRRRLCAVLSRSKRLHCIAFDNGNATLIFGWGGFTRETGNV